VGAELPSRTTDTLVDWIITPTRTIEVERTRPKPSGIDWELLDPTLLDNIPPLQELEARVRRGGDATA
jgi:hypothetical protein